MTVISVSETAAQLVEVAGSEYGERTARGRIVKKLTEAESVPSGSGYARKIDLPDSLKPTLLTLLGEAREHAESNSEREALRVLRKRLEQQSLASV